MTKLLEGFDKESPFESVDIDWRSECKEDWSKDYAIAIVSPAPWAEDEFFDEEACRERLIQHCVDRLGGSSHLTIRVRDGKPSRPWRVGDYALLFHHSEEIELYKLDKSNVAALLAGEKRREDARKRALRQARRKTSASRSKR